MGQLTVIGPKLVGTTENPFEGKIPDGTGQNGVDGEVVSPIAEIMFPAPFVIKFPWLSVTK